MLNLEPSPQSFVTKEVLFIIGEPLTTNTSIPIARRHATLIRNPNTTFQRRVFYNGELITTTNPSKEVRLPSEVITGVAPMLGEMAIMVRLKLPRPIPEDEGVYEVQLFVDISQLPTPNCLDYTDFIRTSDGLDLPNVLVGSATLYIRQQGNKKNNYQCMERHLIHSCAYHYYKHHILGHFHCIVCVFIEYYM